MQQRYVHRMQFPIDEYTAGVLEDLQPLAFRSGKAYWLHQRSRKKNHDAVRGLVVLLQPLGFALRELCTFETSDIPEVRHITSDYPEQLLGC